MLLQAEAVKSEDRRSNRRLKWFRLMTGGTSNFMGRFSIDLPHGNPYSLFPATIILIKKIKSNNHQLRREI